MYVFQNTQRMKKLSKPIEKTSWCYRVLRRNKYELYSGTFATEELAKQWYEQYGKQHEIDFNMKLDLYQSKYMDYYERDIEKPIDKIRFR